jgi:hypothetical protein
MATHCLEFVGFEDSLRVKGECVQKLIVLQTFPPTVVAHAFFLYLLG